MKTHAMAGSRGALLSILIVCAIPASAESRIDPSDLAGTAVLTFADEFDSLSVWDGRSGTWETTFPWSVGNGGSSLASNKERQWYIDAAFVPTRSIRPWTTRDGTLEITARPIEPAIRPVIGGYRYVSGLLTTSRSFRQRYGYFEMRAKLPKGRGLWPAFWLLPPEGKWPPEIDVVEVLGHDPGTIYASVHFEKGGRPAKEVRATRVPDTSLGWHTYGVRWEPEEITWFFDGKAVFATKTPPGLNDPMYLLINLAVGGEWPGDPDESTPFPATLMVDYVRAYRSK